jgi:hypothetical protein
MDNIIRRYYRDDKELSYEEWIKLFKEDLEKEAEGYTWDIRGAVWTDYGNGRDQDLNGHEYKARTDEVYDTAKELLESMIFDGKHSELIDAIESFTEAEAEMFVKYIDRVKKNNGMFILEDDEDY